MLYAFVKKITFTLILLLISLPTFSLEIGDTIDPEIAKQLNIPAGKVGIIDFFASWCLSCAKEIPELNDFDANESTNQTKVLGIDVDEELEEGLVFQRKFNVKFAVHNDTTQKINIVFIYGSKPVCSDTPYAFICSSFSYTLVNSYVVVFSLIFSIFP